MVTVVTPLVVSHAFQLFSFTATMLLCWCAVVILSQDSQSCSSKNTSRERRRSETGTFTESTANNTRMLRSMFTLKPSSFYLKTSEYFQQAYSLMRENILFLCSLLKWMLIPGTIIDNAVHSLTHSLYSQTTERHFLIITATVDYFIH